MSTEKPKFWVWELMQSADNRKVRHFKTIEENGFEVKIYFTDAYVIFMIFHDGVHKATERKIRRPHDSLLGFETLASQALASKSPTESLSLSLLN